MFLQKAETILRSNLLRQTTAVMDSILPSASVFALMDHHVPLAVRQLLVEVPLNRMFADAIEVGDFDDFEGRTIRLEVFGGQPGLTLGFWQGRLRMVEGDAEATIKGSWQAFRQLLNRQQDPDQLFFQRRLLIEGNTELGLGLKNLLDSLDWSVRSAIRMT